MYLLTDHTDLALNTHTAALHVAAHVDMLFAQLAANVNQA